MHSTPRPTRARLSRAVRLSLYGLPLATALPLAATAASAADTDPTVMAVAAAGAADPRTLDGVVVNGERIDYRAEGTWTATKTPTPLLDVPQSLSVVSERQIGDQAMQNMADVVRYVPGVQMAQGEGHRDAPVLRGNTSTADFFLNGMRDDVQYYRDLYNVERVEVLKGPSGMIFGRGGAGGLINRVTRQANWLDNRKLSLTLGSWDNRRLTADFGHAPGETVAFRATGMYEDSESYRDHVGLERWAVNPTLSVRAGDATTITIGYEHFEDERIVDRGIPSYQGRPLALDASTYFGQPGSSPADATVDALDAGIEHEFTGGARLVNRTRHADYDKFYQNVFPGAYSPDTGTVSISAYSNRTARSNLINQTDLTFDFRTGAVTHTLLAGVEISRQETENFRQTGWFTDIGPDARSGAVTLPDTIYDGTVEFRQSATDADNRSVAKATAVYLQDQIAFSPRWLAVLGVRYDRFEADLDNRRSGESLSSSDDLVSPRAGLIHKPREDLSVYASYGLAYVPRAGEQLASLTASNRALDPEEFTNREIGLKWDFDDRLSFTAAAYRLDRTNVAITDPDDPTRSLLVDGQRVQGLELGLSGQLTDAWRVMAGYAFQDSEVRTPGAQDGNVLGQVPRHSFSLWNRYDFNDRWGAGLGVVAQDGVFVSTDNTVVLPGHARVDAAVYYTLSPRLRLQLNVENLLDRGYYASAHSNNNITPGAPRAARLGLDFSF